MDLPHCFCKKQFLRFESRFHVSTQNSSASGNVAELPRALEKAACSLNFLSNLPHASSGWHTLRMSPAAGHKCRPSRFAGLVRYGADGSQVLARNLGGIYLHALSAFHHAMALLSGQGHYRKQPVSLIIIIRLG